MNETLEQENVFLRKVLMMVEAIAFDIMCSGMTDAEKVEQIQDLISFYKERHK